MARNGCANCGQEPIVIYWLDDNGVRVYPPVVDNQVEIPNPVSDTPWAGIGGTGITITSGGTQGHAPTIAACIADSPDNALALVGNCLFVPSSDSSPNWSSPNQTAVLNGVSVTAGGVQGHSPLFGIVPSPDSPLQISFDSAGRLVVSGDLTDLAWQGAAGENVVITPGDNPGGDSGNGHRPRIAVREGAALCAPLEFDCIEDPGTGQRTLRVVNSVTGGVVTLAGPF